MGDSYIGNYDKRTGVTGCLFQVRNSGLLQPMDNWDWTATATMVGRGRGVSSLFRDDTAKGYLLWPTGGYQSGDTVYVYNSSQKDSAGGLGFTRGHNDVLAKMVMPGLRLAGYDPLGNFGEASFGLGFDADEPDGYIYTWGIRLFSMGRLFIRSISIQRMRS